MNWVFLCVISSLDSPLLILEVYLAEVKNTVEILCEAEVGKVLRLLLQLKAQFGILARMCSDSND